MELQRALPGLLSQKDCVATHTATHCNTHLELQRALPELLSQKDHLRL